MRSGKGNPEVFNPIIIVAVIVQAFISKASRMAGAIAGFVITTGILLWGISVYGEGSEITFFGIPLSQTVFIVVCLVWYGFDTKALFSARAATAGDSAKQAENNAALENPAVREAWVATWRAWGAGLYTDTAKAEANNASVDTFVDTHIRKYGRLVAAATRQRPFEPNEFIVVASSKDTFLVTNKTFYLFPNENPIPGTDQVIPLRDIDEYHFDTRGSGRVTMKLQSGRVIDNKMTYAPKDEVMNRFSRAARESVSA